MSSSNPSVHPHVARQIRHAIAALSGGLTLATCASAQNAPTPVVEYYNAALDSYFITGRSNEQALLDGLPADFKRTGMSFVPVTGVAAGQTRICRFYVNVPPAAGVFASTHFYGREQLDCEPLLRNTPPGFNFEGYDFTVQSPASDGSCPASAPQPVYRSFRPVFDGRTSNHRYLTSAASYQAMQAAGWSGEGVTFCVSSTTDASYAPEASFKRLVSGGSAIPTPFDPNCAAGQSGTLYVGAEVGASLAIDPANTQHMIAAWQQDRWSNDGARGTVAAASFDGGLHWQSSRVPFSRCAGGTYERATDAQVAIGANGVAYQMALGFSGEDYTASAIGAMMVARSRDGGLNWDAPITLIRDTGAEFVDTKHKIAADPNDARYAYAIWERADVINTGAAWFARTKDGGESWEAARKIYEPGLQNQAYHNQILVRRDGSVLHVFVNIVRIAQPQSPQLGIFLRAERSTDHGLTWSPPATITTDQGIRTEDPQLGRIRDSDGHPSLTEAPDGTIYIVWQDTRFSGGARNGIALSSSKDGGLTWTAPIRVNQRGEYPAFSPTVAVRKDGTIGVSYYDLRNAQPSTPLKATYRLATSRDGSTWRDSEIEWAVDFAQAPNAKGWFTGEYFGLVGRGSAFGILYPQVTGQDGNRTDIVYANIAEGSLIWGSTMAKRASGTAAFSKPGGAKQMHGAKQ